TLFAGSLAWSVDDNALYAAFESFEGLVGARVVTEKGTGRSRGFGYVDFKDAESAAVAYEAMQGQDVGGRAINLDYANARPDDANPQNRAADRAKKHGDTLSAESDTLFVGNLPFDTDQDTVTEFFNEVRPVTSVRLPTDPESGNLKGFGYVTFGSVEDAKEALNAKNGATIGSGRFARSVRLDFSSPRPQGGAGGGRGGFGGGRGGPRGGGGRGGRGGRGGFGGGRGGNFSAVNRTKPAGTKISFD
ncbi:RNA-binding domain-containing protein, partial [Trichoderma citrinoviride]